MGQKINKSHDSKVAIKAKREALKDLSSIRSRSGSGSELISRMSLAANLGQQFGGKRDLYAIYGYKTALSFNDYLAKYTRQDISKRIVDAPAKSTWRNAPRITDDQENEKETAFETAWLNMQKNNRVYHYMERLDRAAGIGQYAVMLMGFNDGKALNEPVQKADKLNYLSIFTQENACVLKLDNDTTSERFGLPLMYKITFSRNDSTTRSSDSSLSLPDQPVHWSRILHVAEDKLEDDTRGTPRLEAIYNVLDDMLKVVGGSGEMFWLSARQGLVASADPDYEFDEPAKEALETEIDEYQHELRRFMRTNGVDVKSLESKVASPKDQFDIYISLIAGTTGIPKRILIGSERGELASNQDERNWNARVMERQNNFAEPEMLRPFIDIQMKLGTLQQVDEYEVVWPNLTELTPLEKAEVAVKLSSAVKNVAPLGSPELVLPPGEARELLLDLPPESEELQETPFDEDDDDEA